MNTKQRIDELEKQVTELKAQYEAEQLSASKQAYDGIARNVGEARFSLGSDGVIYSIDAFKEGYDYTSFGAASAFTSREAAERELKTRQLIRDAKIAMLADWGDVKCDWSDESQHKHYISLDDEVLDWDICTTNYHFLAFRTPEARDAFRNSHTDEELILIITNGMGL